jgi:predicted RNase H-like nuclease (RuvC/YqgF family)
MLLVNRRFVNFLNELAEENETLEARLKEFERYKSELQKLIDFQRREISELRKKLKKKTT